VKGGTTLAIALAATAALPAAADAQKTSYRVTDASGSYRVTFRADTANCARYLTCGYAGTLTYKLSGAPHGSLVLKEDRRGHVTGSADFRASGTTTANITAGTVCNDKVRHTREHFSLDSKSRLGRLIFGLHGGKTDYLTTDCAGPTEANLKRDGALPNGKFKRSDFDAPSTTFGLKGSAPFREKGYRGDTTWKLKYRVARRG
jgi:hypothetical protein